MNQPFDFAAVSYILVAHSGRYFRFKRAADGTLTAHVCYWKGVVLPPGESAAGYQAYVEQKYAPYQQIWAEGVLLESEKKALDWVAERLILDEETASD